MTGFMFKNVTEIKKHKEAIKNHTEKALSHLCNSANDPLKAMFEMKFEPIGFHPTAGHPLNLIEQINQTFTYLCALEASEMLFGWHSDLDGLVVFPGAHAPQGTLDIEAVDRPGFIGAELFSAVTPTNNRKLQNDLEKLRDRPEIYRYEFFICKTHRETKRQETLEKYGVQVWSLWPFPDYPQTSMS